ncbi:MAG: hypothetical protein HOP16_18920 [Acidobacteria bacterium]|nr:hypothetical protein [Acidobacteriota bacterium]
MGMDENIVTSYLLQVGRSYYTSPTFLRAAHFTPTSQFGVGFLSVFAASDEVVVDTLSFAGQAAEPLRLTLTGPRNYLLVDKGSRTTPGTTVSVRLRDRIEVADVVTSLRQWCRRVEFPIEVRGDEARVTIIAETASDFTFSEVDHSSQGKLIELKAFDVDRPGIDGELYVLAIRSEDPSKNDEDWARMNWYKYSYTPSYPQTVNRVPASVSCFHGITLTEGEGSADAMIARLDYRRSSDRVTLARSGRLRQGLHNGDAELRSRWVEVLDEHLRLTSLATGEDRWDYVQRLIDRYESLGDYWTTLPRAVRFFCEGTAIQVSAAEATPWDTITLLWEDYNTYKPDWDHLKATAAELKGQLSGVVPTLSTYDVLVMSELHKEMLFGNRGVERVELVGNDYLRIFWGPRDRCDCIDEGDRQGLFFANAGTAVGVACGLHVTYRHKKAVLVNTSTPLGLWLKLILNYAAQNPRQLAVRPELLARLKELLIQAATYISLVDDFAKFVDRLVPLLPAELRFEGTCPSTSEDFGVFTARRMESIQMQRKMTERFKHRPELQ